MSLARLHELGKLLGPLVSVWVEPFGDVLFRDENHGLAVVQPFVVLAGRGGDDGERPQRLFKS